MKVQIKAEVYTSDPYDNVEARNALLELLQGSLTVGDIKNYIIRKRLKQASDMYNSWVEQMEAYHRSGNEVIIYEKKFEDGYIYYLEEKRDNRKSLAFQTMYKKKKRD